MKNKNTNVNTNANANTNHKKEILIGVHRAYEALFPDETGCYHPASVDSTTRDFALDGFLEKHLDDGLVKIEDAYYLPLSIETAQEEAI